MRDSAPIIIFLLIPYRVPIADVADLVSPVTRILSTRCPGQLHPHHTAGYRYKQRDVPRQRRKPRPGRPREKACRLHSVTHRNYEGCRSAVLFEHGSRDLEGERRSCFQYRPFQYRLPIHRSSFTFRHFDVQSKTWLTFLSATEFLAVVFNVAKIGIFCVVFLNKVSLDFIAGYHR